MQTAIRNRPIIRNIPIFEVTAVSSSNQPAGAAVKVVSDNAGDTQKITIWGYKTGALTTLVSEELTLTGVTPVTSSGTTWQTITGAFLGDNMGNISARATGSVTVTNASGSTIYTIAATKLSAGTQHFLINGRNIEIENITGNTFYNTVEPTSGTTGVLRATTTGASWQLSGRMSNYIKALSYISLTSDVSGSTTQIRIFDI